jgi:hypothetical protein
MGPHRAFNVLDLLHYSFNFRTKEAFYGGGIFIRIHNLTASLAIPVAF